MEKDIAFNINMDYSESIADAEVDEFFDEVCRLFQPLQFTPDAVLRPSAPVPCDDILSQGAAAREQNEYSTRKRREELEPLHVEPPIVILTSNEKRIPHMVHKIGRNIRGIKSIQVISKERFVKPPAAEELHFVHKIRRECFWTFLRIFF